MPSARLYKTGVASPTNDKIWTLSAWFKFNQAAGGGHLYFASGGNSNDNWTQVRASSESLSVSAYNTEWLRTSAKLRDTSAWYHIVIAADSTQGTASNRLKIYINGEEASYGTDNRSSISQNQTWGWNKGSVVHNIGGENASGYGDFVMAHCHNVDGTAYTPTTFGETDATTGIWKPKTSPTVTYGNNGWFLKFDNSANMGLDSAGSNNLTTGGTIIQAKDTPSNVFACLNRLDFDSSNTTLTNINNTLTGGNQGVAYNTVRANMGATKGKWYWEVKAADNAEIDQIGVSEMTFRPAIGNTGGFTSNINAYGAQLSNGYKVGLGQSGAAYMGGFSANDIMMIALDLDNDKITFGRNGQWADGSGNANQTYANSTAAFTGLTSDLGYMPTHCMRDSAGNNSGTSHYNFGNGVFGTSAVASAENPDDGVGIFEYDPPTGFRAWCTKSLTAQEFN